MLLRRWLTSVMAIGCSGPPPTRRKIHVECNHSEMHHSMVQGLETSFPGEMVQVERTDDSQYVGMFHCCFCPPGKQDNHRGENNDDDWFDITTWESELTRWAQTIRDDIEHCAIVLEPDNTIVTSL